MEQKFLERTTLAPIEAMEFCNALRKAKISLNGFCDMNILDVIPPEKDDLQRLVLCLPNTQQAVSRLGFDRYTRVRFAFSKSKNDVMSNFTPKLEFYDASGNFVKAIAVEELDLTTRLAVELELMTILLAKEKQ